MWELLKTRKVSFPYTLTTFDEAVIKETQAMEKCSREEALAQIFSVGMYLHIENLNRELNLKAMMRYRELCKKEKEINERISATNTDTDAPASGEIATKSIAPSQPTRASIRHHRITTRVIPERHARISYDRRHTKTPVKMLRFNSDESRKIYDAGYRYYGKETSTEGLCIFLSKKKIDNSAPINFFNNGRYVYARLHDKVGYTPLVRQIESQLCVTVHNEECLDVPYVIKEDRERLVFSFKKANSNQILTN